MLQTGALIRDLSVRELITMIGSLYPASLDTDEVIDLVGLEQVADRRTQKLSGGETQRVRFAVALASNGSLLVLDEPTVAMDVESRHAFWATMREITSQGRTVIFATHYLEEADAFADRVVLMARGENRRGRRPRRSRRWSAPGRSGRRFPAPVDELAALPGVTNAELRGDAIVLICSDSDAAVRALLERYPAARDVEITGAGLEEAFLQLTGDDDE